MRLGFQGSLGFRGQRSTCLPQGRNWTCGSFGPRVVWMQPWSMPRPGAAMRRSCCPGPRREPALVRVLPPAPGSRQLPFPAQLRPLLSPPRARFYQKHYEDRRGWQGVNPPAGNHDRHPSPPEPSPFGKNRSPTPPLDPQHLPPPPQSHMPLQYIYTLFLEHDLSLGALAMETVAQQKRDYYQVREPCCPRTIPFAPLGGRAPAPAVLFC